MAKDGARSGALRGRTRAAFERHMRWIEGREGVNISEGRRASRMYKAGPGSLAGQGRELEGEKCKETEREKK